MALSEIRQLFNFDLSRYLHNIYNLSRTLITHHRLIHSDPKCFLAGKAGDGGGHEGHQKNNRETVFNTVLIELFQRIANLGSSIS